LLTIVQNPEVSDTTGDATNTKRPDNKNKMKFFRQTFGLAIRTLVTSKKSFQKLFDIQTTKK
jgi:hypothetical protein